MCSFGCITRELCNVRYTHAIYLESLLFNLLPHLQVPFYDRHTFWVVELESLRMRMIIIVAALVRMMSIEGEKVAKLEY